jgi:hypothetical protein
MPATLAQPSQSSQTSQITTQSVQPSPVPAAKEESSSSPVLPENEGETGNKNISGIVAIIVFIAAVVIGFVFRVLLKKK